MTEWLSLRDYAEKVEKLEAQLTQVTAEKLELATHLGIVKEGGVMHYKELLSQLEGSERECARLRDVALHWQELGEAYKTNEVLAEEQLEVERMRLAACSAAALSNTEKTVKQRIGRDNPYWSASYWDVCRAVDREMALRDKQLVLDTSVKCPNCNDQKFFQNNRMCSTCCHPKWADTSAAEDRIDKSLLQEIADNQKTLEGCLERLMQSEKATGDYPNTPVSSVTDTSLSSRYREELESMRGSYCHRFCDDDDSYGYLSHTERCNKVKALLSEKELITCTQGHRHLKPPKVFVLRSVLEQVQDGDGTYVGFTGSEFEVQWDEDSEKEHSDDK